MPLIATEKTLRPIDIALTDLLQRQFPQADKQHAQLAGLISYHLADGHLCLPLNQVEQKAKALNLAIASDAAYQTSDILSEAQQTPVIRDLQRLYLYRYWQLEKQISQHIQQRLALKETVKSADIAPILAKLFPLAEEAGLNGETNWQKVACVLAARQNFSVITGGPGTGKTTTVIKLLTLLQTLHFQQTEQYLSIKLAAPTGKAAARLSESIAGALDKIKKLGFDDDLIAHLPAKATTLHRLLGRQPKTRHFRHNQNNPIAAELIVVDEASMIDIDMMQALLQACPSHSQLILVGDKDQLASVEAGAVMSELCEQADELNYSSETLSFLKTAGCELKIDAHIGTRPTALAQAIGKLQKCWRAESLSIIDLARAINQQQTSAVTTILQQNPNELSRITIQPQWIEQQIIRGDTGIKQLFEQIKQDLAQQKNSEDIAKAALKLLAKQQLLTPLRKGFAGVEGLNQQIRQVVQNFAEQYGFAKAKTFSATDEYFIGEPLLVSKNLYDLGVMNGDIGIVLPYQDKGLRVAFDNGEGGIRWVIPEQLQNNSQGAYAITVHQSQGSEYERVLLYMPSEWNPVLSKELLYTAVTRAKKSFVLLESQANQTILEQMVNYKTERYSGVAERLYQIDLGLTS